MVVPAAVNEPKPILDAFEPALATKVVTELAKEAKYVTAPVPCEANDETNDVNGIPLIVVVLPVPKTFI